MQILDFGQKGSFGLCKTADENALDFAKSVKAKAGKTYVLVLAMSASEYYGANKNGDAFPEKPIPGLIGDGETLKDNYKTFETNAKVFRHHRNKDPEESFGEVLRAFYNDKMHRVELLLEIDNQRGADVIKKIEQGQYPPVSMGTRVPYDICSICHHRAKNLSEYCKHAKHHMNDIDPETGKQVYVLNPSPTLFDISFVLRPADKIAYMMKKVANHREPTLSSAEMGEIVKLNQLKASAIRKLSDIDKTITGQTMEKAEDPALLSFAENILPTLIEGNIPSFSHQLCDDLSSLPLNRLFSTLHKAEVVPTGKEFCHIIIRKSFPEKEIDPKIYDLISAIQDPIRSLIGEIPEILDALQNFNLVEAQGDNAEDKIIEKNKDELEKRSHAFESIYRRAVPTKYADISRQGLADAMRKPIFDPVEFTVDDRKYMVSEQILDEVKKKGRNRQLLGTLGTAALSLGGFGALAATGRASTAARATPWLLGGGYLGTRAVHDALGTPTHPGTDIPVGVPKRQIVKGASDSGSSDSGSSELSLLMIAAQEYWPSVSRKTASFEESRDHHISLLKAASKKSNFIRKMVQIHGSDSGLGKKASTKDEAVEFFEDRYLENPSDPAHRGPVRLENLIMDLGEELVSATI